MKTLAELKSSEEEIQGKINVLHVQLSDVRDRIVKEEARVVLIDKFRNCYTPEDFAAAGLTLHSDPGPDYFWGLTEDTYWTRVSATLPTRPPRFKVGEWAYNPLDNHNARVVGVEWDRGIGQWRYHLPGYGSPDVYGPDKNRPNVEYVEIKHRVWAPSRTDQQPTTNQQPTENERR